MNTLLDVARKISDSLKAIHGDLQQHIKTVSTKNERSEQKCDQLPIPLEVKLEEDQEGKRDTDSKRQYAVHNSIRKATWCTFIATAAAFGAAAYYARTAKKQLGEMEIATHAAVTSANAAEAALRSDRAWIYMRLGQVKMIPGLHIEIPVGYINKGKTPTRLVSGKFATEVLKRGEDPDFSYEHSASITGGATFPETPEQFSYYVPNLADRSSALAKSDPLGDLILTKRMKQALTSGDMVIANYGRIEYDDTYGVHHWVSYCGHLSGNPKSYSKKCVDYNDVDENH